MPSFRIRHPHERDRCAEYGWDGPSGLGFFVHVYERDVDLGRYDGRSTIYDHLRPLLGALMYLVQRGFFSNDDLEEALERLPHERPEEMPRRLRRVANVVCNMKEAAD